MTCFSRDQHACEMWDYIGDYFWICFVYVWDMSFSFFPWLSASHGFSKSSREQYEKLSTMHKNMQKLYENIGSYFAFDPHSVSVEEFFGELANFRMLFMVSANFLIFCTRTQTRSFKVGTYVDFCTRLLAHTGCQWIENRGCVLHMHTFSSNFQGPDRWWKLVRKLHCCTFMDALE